MRNFFYFFIFRRNEDGRTKWPNPFHVRIIKYNFRVFITCECIKYNTSSAIILARFYFLIQKKTTCILYAFWSNYPFSIWIDVRPAFDKIFRGRTIAEVEYAMMIASFHFSVREGRPCSLAKWTCKRSNINDRVLYVKDIWKLRPGRARP